MQQSYKDALLDYLRAGRDRIAPDGYRAGFGVNYTHCRPLHPHGMRMVREGLLELRRVSRGGNARMTTLHITDAGLARLEHLEKREARHAAKYSDTQ